MNITMTPFEWLATVECNSLSLTRNDGHAPNYMTAQEWITEEMLGPDSNDFERCSDAEIKEMMDTNTIWSLQIYPNTPIGFNIWSGPTAENVIRKAMESYGDWK